MNTLNKTLNLSDYQTRMGLHLRDPEHEAAPENLNARRLGVYRDLVFANIESQLAGSFPVIKSVLEADRWLALVREFLRDHRAETPYFPQLSAEFVSFLAERDQVAQSGDLSLPAFLLELAHYERIEIDLFMQDEEYDRQQLDQKALLSQPLGLVSAVQLLAYAFPVHRIAPSYQPETAPDAPTLLLLFQDDDGEVKFYELQPLAYQLVHDLAQSPSLTGTQLLEALADQLNLPFTETFQQQGLQLLAQLNQLKVLRPQNT